MADSYKVWDEQNSAEEFAHDIVAFDAEEAAEKYAEEDVDGNIDCSYFDGPQLINVRCPDGALKQFNVTAEAVPEYTAVEVDNA